MSDQLLGCHLPDAWADSDSWTVLDTEFEQGKNFVVVLAAWRADPHKPKILHYVGFNPTSIGRIPGVHLTQIDQVLNAALLELDSGFSRLDCEGGSVTLTLCSGDLQHVFKEQRFQADSVFLGPGACDKWSLKLLARKCRRGTRFSASHPSQLEASELSEAGFLLDEYQPGIRRGVFNPPWQVMTTRHGPIREFAGPGRCAIIGAGVCGATVAHALALRGWQISVFDTHKSVAGAASGLPVGLVVPHVSQDDGVRSRLSRAGARMLLDYAKRFLKEGQDWSPCGVMESHTRWHSLGSWLKPKPLIGALLENAKAIVRLETFIKGLRRQESHWWLSDASGHCCGSFELVVFANAMGSTILLDSAAESGLVSGNAAMNLRSLHPVHGMVSLGQHDAIEHVQDKDTFPPTPVNGHGSFIPRIPTPQGETWYVGATFERNAIQPSNVSSQHQANLSRLLHLHTVSGVALAPQFNNNQVDHWSGTRCVTHDRLPLVGPLHSRPNHGLWIVAGMGARGLSFSALCAELLAARIGGEPLPVEASLAKCLDVQRAQRGNMFKPSVTGFGLALD